MSILYPWIFFLYIPLYLFFKSDIISKEKYQKRQKILLYLTLVLMIFALSRPVIPNALSEQKIEAKDYIIAIDASFSMQGDDLLPTRYDVAKKNIESILKKSPKDRFSLFAFTSNTMLISPPTTDTDISMMALDALEPKYILTKGTSLLELFKTVAKTPYAKKNLIIFSDGGEDYDLQALVGICKNSAITPYIVATASKQGTALKKDDKPLIDSDKNLVISRINPILEPLAQDCGGSYIQLDASKDISDAIISKIKNEDAKIETSLKVLNYKELYPYLLVSALILFLLAVTKLHQIYFIFLLFFMPNISHGSMLFDFYHLKNADRAYKSGNFEKSAKEFYKLTPSVQSYYNSGVSYYKAKEYKKAIQIFMQIKSPDAKLKQLVFYNIANCAVALKKYDKAKIYYQKALALGFDLDTFENLTLLYALKTKNEKVFTRTSHNKRAKKPDEKAKEKESSKKEKNGKKSTSKSKSNQQASQKSSGSGKNSAKKTIQKAKQSSKQMKKPKYKIGYSAYDLINKGYTDEKHPW